MMTILALHSQAAEYYVGADVVPLNLWRQSKYIICSSNCTGVSDGSSNGAGIRIGMWLPRDGNSKTGWEIGYDTLGSISGSTTYYPQGCPLLCLGPSTTATWRHEATMVHVDMLGAATDKGEALFGKIGLFRSIVRSEGNFGLGSGPYSRTVTGTGLLLGAGYIYPVTPRLSARLASDLFLFAKVADPINPGGTLSDIFVKVALGMDYTF